MRDDMSADDGGDHWIIDLKSGKVTQVCLDYALTLVVGDDVSGDTYEIRIEGPAHLHHQDGGSDTVDPASFPSGGTEAIRMLHKVVLQILVFKAGGLKLVLGGGLTLSAHASPEFEAWSVVGPGKLRLVSSAGGGVAVWRGQAESD